MTIQIKNINDNLKSFNSAISDGLSETQYGSNRSRSLDQNLVSGPDWFLSFYVISFYF